MIRDPLAVTAAPAESRKRRRPYLANYGPGTPGREKLKAQARARYWANHEKSLEQRERYREEHRAELRAKEAERARAKRAANPGYHVPRMLARLYGMTVEDYDAMVAAQGGRCAICGTREAGKKSGRWCVDHGHASGRVRALLCQHCNLVLGHAKDRSDVLRAAAEYLERHARAEAADGEA